MHDGRIDMRWRAILLALLLLAGCGKQQEVTYQPEFSQGSGNSGREYIIGIHPLHNPKRLVEVYGPIIDRIKAAIPQARFRLEASRNYEEYEKKLYSTYFDFAMPNPYQTVRSLKHGYKVFGKMGNDELFRGIILVRRDSGIRKVTDLRGNRISYPARTALAATMMPQYYLHTHGIDVNRDVESVYVGSQESSIMSVLRGHVAAGASWPVPWNIFRQENPELAAQLVVRWQTETLPNNGWVVRSDIPSSLRDKFGEVLFGLDESAEGRALLKKLGIDRFEKASDATFKPVQQYLKRFSATVRQVEY